MKRTAKKQKAAKPGVIERLANWVQRRREAAVPL
jgi:hypothetical protein